MARKLLARMVLALSLLFVFAPVAESATDTRQTFVQGLFKSLFGRAASKTEMAAWEGYLVAHPDTVGASSMVRFLCNQAEFRNRSMTPWGYVWDLYQGILGRAPSSDEDAAWANAYIAGFNTAMPTFVGSPEFQSRFPNVRDRGVASRLIARLYSQVLGQPPDTASAWIDYLVTSGDTEHVALGFFNFVGYLSVPRTLDQHVAILYRALLGRDSSPEESQAWITYFVDQLETIEDGFINSAEFQARAARVLTLVAALHPGLADAPRAEIGAMLDIGPGVPRDQVEIIDQGLTIAENFFESDLGGGIPEDVRRNMTVKIVATGRGNQEQGGACCTAFSIGASGEAITRPFFDTSHVNWSQAGSRPVVLGFWTATDGGHKAVAHEWTHDWQATLGCLSIFNQPLGFWLNEGIAEKIAHEAMIERGVMRRADVMDHMTYSARVTGQLSRPLRDFGATTADLWPGHVGFIAVDNLVHRAPNGIMSLRTVCEQVAQGVAVSEAFQRAFGVSLDQFYSEFEVMRQQLLSALK